MIYINARFLTQPVTGVQRFAIEISKELVRQNKLSYTFIAPSNIKDTALAQELNVQVIGKRFGHLWEQTELPLFLRRRGNPVLLNLANTAPLAYKNNVITIHDLAFIHHRKWFSWKFRAFYNFLIPRIVKQARHIFTVSKFSESEIITVLNANEKKISVIYNAASEIFQPKQPLTTETEKYVLTVGSQDPRKNLENIIKGFSDARKKIKANDLKLKIVGGGSSLFNFPVLENPEIFRENGIEFLGRINDQELVNAFHGAIAFIYPSLYEGFGLPNIEAMKCGVPVVTSDIPIMHEICQDAALYVDPAKSDEIGKGILALVNSPKLQKELIDKGNKVSENYSWERSADSLARTLKDKINENK